MKPKIKSKSLVYPLILLALFSLAIFIRLFHWQNYPLGFDQVQILDQAEQIKAGHFTLIGPRTGPAAMFTGPLIYYFTAGLMFIIPSPFTLIATAIVIAAITGITLYYLASRYLKNHLSLLIAALWAMSPYFITLDRIPWNPNLVFLAASLVFFPLVGTLKHHRLTFTDSILVSLGVFLGYQAHFSGLLLFPLFVLVWLIYFRQSIISLILVSCGLLLSLLPTFLFDLRHHWLNFQGLTDFLNQKTTTSLSFIFPEVIQNVYITLENLGKILFFNNTPILIVITGFLTVLAFSLLVFKRKINLSLREAILIGLWLISIIIVYGLYRETSFARDGLPEYYFLIQMPVLLYLLAKVLTQLFKSNLNHHFLFIAAFSGYSLIMMVNSYSPPEKGMTLANQLQLINFLKQQNQSQPISEVIFDMDENSKIGLSYLLSPIQFSPEGLKAHLVYPYWQGDLAAQNFTDVAVWFDPRIDPGKNYLTLSNLIIETPPTTFLYQDNYATEFFHTPRVFLIETNNQKIGWLAIYDPQAKTEFQALQAQFDHKGIAVKLPYSDLEVTWYPVEIDNQPGWARVFQDKIIATLPLSSQNVDQIFQLVLQFALYDGSGKSI